MSSAPRQRFLAANRLSMAGVILSMLSTVTLPAQEYCPCPPVPSDPNHHQRPGMNNHHWPHLKQILKGPVDYAPSNQAFWYSKDKNVKLKGYAPDHTWCDYAFMGDCYNDDWRTTTFWDCEKTADFHRRTRSHSLALEQAWCRVWRKCQNGYLADTSGTRLLNIPRAQSECGIPPQCGSMFGGHAPLYAPYAFRPRQPSLMPVPDCPVEITSAAADRSMSE